MQSWVDNRAGHYGLLLLLGLGAFFLGLGSARLWEIDEGRNSTAAYEMMEAEDWIVPTFNGELRVDKPALLYWLQIASYSVFGVDEFSARLPSALAALLATLIVYELGRELFGRRTGLLAGAMFATSVMVVAAGRFANPDALLNLCSVLALWLFWRSFARTGQHAFFGCSLACGLGILAKGPVGLLLPFGVMVLYLLWVGKIGILFRWRLLLGAATLVAVAGPWYILVAAETNGEFLLGFLGKHNVGRYLQPMENHSGGIWYYPLVLTVGLLPWSIFLFFTLWHGYFSARTGLSPRWQRWADVEGSRPAQPEQPPPPPLYSRYRFLWCWIGLYVLFFTFAATKLPNYVLPAVAPLVLLTARMVDRWLAGKLAYPAWLMHASLSSLAAVGIVTGASFLVVAGVIPIGGGKIPHIPQLAGWAALGIVPMLGATFGSWYFFRGDRLRLLISVALSGMAYVVVTAVWVLPVFNGHKPPKDFVSVAAAVDRSRDLRLGVYNLGHYSSLHFYARRYIDILKRDDDVRNLLAFDLPVYVILPKSDWGRIRAGADVSTLVLDERPDLYRREPVVLVTNVVEHRQARLDR